MNYYLKRFFMWGLVIYLSISLTFVLIRFLPGGPEETLINQYLQRGMSYREAVNQAQLVINYDADAPIWQQYINYVSDIILRGDFGKSIFMGDSAVKLYANAIPWSIYISVTALGVNFLSGVGLGALIAYKEGSRLDTGVTTYMIWSNAVPFFIVAILLLIFLGYQAQWFPTGGRYNPYTTPGFNIPFLRSVIYHAALPLSAVILTGLGGPAISMRANSIRTLGSDYIRVAQLRGLPTNRIALRYVARNAVLPLYTGIVISIGTIFGGSIILEQIFSYPGMGYVMFQAISLRDYPVMMAGFVFLTIGMMTGILAADLTYNKIDPRAGTGASRESY